jgi:hypothetical protein|tara:strand:+ start:369 stop:686 length:318 start_codon:yes stop_codon:yes gene_type:complete
MSNEDWWERHKSYMEHRKKFPYDPDKNKLQKERKDDDYIGAEHPFPKEAPKFWRMAKMKELRKIVMRKKEKRKKEWNLMVHYAKLFMYLIMTLIVISIFTVVFLI